MSLRLLNKVGIQFLQETSVNFLAPIASTSINVQQVRHRRTKHWDPKWKPLRTLKVVKVELPKFNENTEDLTEEEMRSRLKEQGLLPPRPWLEKPFFISSTGGVFEGYVPPEGDGKVSPISAQGAKQKLQFLEKKSKTMLAIRKIRSFEEDFDTPEFCKAAQNVYIKMHECMASGDKETIQQYITERAYPEVMHNMKNKTIRWKYLKDVELPRVVHARCTDVVSKENIFAQVTVRFHTQQVLAIYDRFGRLMHGSEIIAKDVLEYVVFEKHLANEYGLWRVHDKIIPDWMPPKEPTSLTFEKPQLNIIESKEKELVDKEKKPAEIAA
ncbi:PREDICTED: probable 39S ribosomal protein L45, mitochondrial [Nicrophorus vespilloides]|uniref:Large ribosomal subunit protein mL45 n=1 Tax=Nicrophorus vespilloides TaxID=110193 RepID=A0ABM1MKU9_NICVS|nr:PREDICTED: probable 39S ribosomal protein L45, mitochondrial [Nicrophorus vespilloides]